MKKHLKKIFLVLAVFVLVFTPSISFAQEQTSNPDQQQTGLAHYQTFDSPNDIMNMPTSDFQNMLYSRMMSRAWYDGDFYFEGYNVGSSRNYDGNYMAVKINITSNTSIGSGTTVYLRGPGVDRSMSVTANNGDYIMDWVPIQDGAEYYLIYVNQAYVHVHVEMYSWYA
ncbi:hypothetical protein [Acetobacterium carbinolicum]|uniref:hypothetical protein n=1 Tax=Acetobacterium carbinolicum TaxID=52690 RepID=UPI0039C94C73